MNNLLDIPVNASANATDTCNLPSSFWKSVSQLNFFNYNILMPLRLIFGLTGQVMALMAFKQQLQKESAFSYQIYVTVGKIMEISVYSLYILLQYHWAGGIGGILPGVGVPWFTTCYGCMWYVAHLSSTILIAATTLSILLATAMAVDRVLALARPFLYRNINHRRHKMAAILGCVFISILASLEQSWRITVIRKDGHFSIDNDVAYTTSATAAILNNIRTALRLISVGIMVISYGLIIRFYNKRMKQVAQIMATTYKEVEKKRHQKTLYVLVVSQLPFAFLTNALLACTNLLAFCAPRIYTCEGALVLAFAVLSIEMADTLEVYILMAASPAFRKMVISAVPCLRKLMTSTG